MASEKQLLSNRTYQYIGIVTISNDEEFKQFRNRLKKRSDEVFIDRINTLFFLEVKTPETDVANYYAYDYFQNVESLDRLRKINVQKDIEKISDQQQNTQITLAKQEKKLADLANIYGYPHNYRSKMYLGRNYGWTIGAGIGIAIGIALVVIFCIFVMPTIFAPILGTLVNSLFILGPILFIAMCMLGMGGTIVTTQVISAALGAIIGSSIGALVHYCEKTFAQDKMQNQQEDQSTRFNIMNAADEPRHVGNTKNFEPQDLEKKSISSSSFEASILDGDFSPALFTSALDDQLSCTTFCEVLFEDTPFAPK